MSYIGKKPVDFNDVTEAQTFTVTGDLTVDTDTLFVDSTNNLVGIGLTNPSSYYAENLVVAGADEGGITIESGSTEKTYLMFARGTSGQDAYRGYIGYDHNDDSLNVVSSGYMNFFSGSSQIERMRIDSSGTVLVGNTSSIGTTIAGKLQTSGIESFITTNSEVGGFIGVNSNADNSLAIGADPDSDRAGSHIVFYVDGLSEKMRIDSSGDLLVGKTTTNIATAGSRFMTNGQIQATASGQEPFFANRLSSDGVLFDFRKDGTTVGSIDCSGGDMQIGTGDVGFSFNDGNNAILPYNASTKTLVDNFIDLGMSSYRYDDIYATNGTIQTSDQNEKQQIASLTTAEITAAKSISKLFKTFKWNDSVAENGDNARTHSGVIAQDVQTAMTDAGLDAGDYAFFISTTWWETQTDVPAVEAVEAQDAVYDDDGNIVTEAVEAVEAQEAYTRTDTYDTADEAPEGATERTRLGLRYAELLAFVGAATEQRLTHLETLEARIEALENA